MKQAVPLFLAVLLLLPPPAFLRAQNNPGPRWEGRRLRATFFWAARRSLAAEPSEAKTGWAILRPM